MLLSRVLAVEKAVEADYGAKIEAVRKGNRDSPALFP